MIQKQLIECLIKKTDFSDLIFEFVDLNPKGAQLIGVCSFCHLTSFTVAPDKHIWKCFKCNKGSPVFKQVLEKFFNGVADEKILSLLAKIS